MLLFVGAYRPGGHAIGATPAGQYFDGGHGLGTMLPRGHEYPAGHASHAAAALRLLYVPGLQGSGAKAAPGQNVPGGHAYPMASGSLIVPLAGAATSEPSRHT